MSARLSTAALSLALGVLVGGCTEVPPPVPVSRESADEGTARPLETQFERALVIEEVRLGRQ